MPGWSWRTGGLTGDRWLVQGGAVVLGRHTEASARMSTDAHLRVGGGGAEHATYPNLCIRSLSMAQPPHIPAPHSASLAPSLRSFDHNMRQPWCCRPRLHLPSGQVPLQARPTQAHVLQVQAQAHNASGWRDGVLRLQRWVVCRCCRRHFSSYTTPALPKATPCQEQPPSPPLMSTCEHELNSFAHSTPHAAGSNL